MPLPAHLTLSRTASNDVGIRQVFVSVDGLGRTILSYVFTEAALASILSPAVFAILARTQLIAITEEA